MLADKASALEHTSIKCSGDKNRPLSTERSNVPFAMKPFLGPAVPPPPMLLYHL